MSLSERRRDDIPFIGSDPEDMYYQTESGKVFDMTERFYPDFNTWWNELQGFSIRSEAIAEDVKDGDILSIKDWMKFAFETGRNLGYEEASARYEREDDV